ncbi:class II aldolase/adducin N-terminal [Dactylonectria macrodidyma]|uniref:Class II aldolase/adducin N-terminal n=1 Tax=Dactylonectria macrodidyma TaxID=307937 RepID=A0A9P9DRF5_9HYPO|nr:class II aldolase/adducin N-terminal [Dactylonectria macrodidyma]
MAASENPSLAQLHRTFISACHILHYHNVLDAYGHLSFRHPVDPDKFFMARSIAPGTISSPGDVIEYYVADAEPVDPTSAKGYAERCIHSECYKRYPGVRAVIHSHSEAVLPYTISGVPLKPCYHMAGFLGSGVPVWDISDAYCDGDIKDLLVRDTRLGSSLAASLSRRIDNNKTELPDHAVSLMRGHGFTVVAENMESCVLRAIYTQNNASIQTMTLTISAAFGGQTTQHDIKYLSVEEAAAAAQMTKWSAQRPWKLWLREVEACGLYVNSA